MDNVKEYIESGILEAYVLGLASPEEQQEVEEMAAAHAEVREAMNAFSTSYEQYAVDNASVEPHATVKPMLLATLDYMNRMEKGETPVNPPLLKKGSTIADYIEWVDRKDFAVPADFTDIYARIIASNRKVTTAIVWIKEMAPQELHHDEFERFLILEGTCNLVVEDDMYYLNAGDYFEVPLHKNHHVKVTSTIPCKVLLQRVAA